MATAVKHYLLTEDQKAANSGHSDLFVIKYDNATLQTAVADNTAVEVVLDGLVLGDVVFQNALVEITTAWTGPADLTATVSVGVVGTVDALTPTLTITTAGAGTAVGTTQTSANQTNAHYKATTGINLIANFIPDADSGVDEFTAGELKIWLTISRRSTRNIAQA